MLSAAADLVGQGVASITLADAANPDAAVAWNSTATGPAVKGSVVFPLALHDGDSIQLVAQLSVDGNSVTGTATATSRLQFAGLPAGVIVTSCQAYNLPTPAQAATLGALKAGYR